MLNNDKLDKAEEEVERLKRKAETVASELRAVTQGKKLLEAKLADAEARAGESGGSSAAALKERDLARAQLAEATRKAQKLQNDLSSSANENDSALADLKLTMQQLSKALGERDNARSELEGALQDAKETIKLKDERDAALKEAAEAKTKAAKAIREQGSRSVNRRRSLSTSSAGGELGEASELRRKLELKMAELNKYKTQLKNEKSKARRLERDRQAEERDAEANRGDTELELLQSALGRNKEMDSMLTKAASLLYPNGLSQEELSERLLHHPGAGKVMTSTGDWSGDGGAEDMSLRQNHTYFVNASSTANASGMVMAYDTTDAKKGMVPGDIFRDADPAASRALFVSSPWWLDTKRMRPPAPAAAARAAAAIAAVSPSPTGHTGRRVWNEDLEFFEDRNTPAASVAADSSHHSDHFSEPEPESDHDFIDELTASRADNRALRATPSPGRMTPSPGLGANRAGTSTTYDLAGRTTPIIETPASTYHTPSAEMMETPAMRGPTGMIRPLQITRLGSATNSPAGLGGRNSPAEMRAALEGRTSSGRSPVPPPKENGSAFPFSTQSKPGPTIQLGLVETNTHL